MRFHADLHIHSKYSRACSRDCDLEHLTWWARRKGVTVVGTGDFTHPAWFDHLRDNLVPAEPGLFRLRDDVDREVDRRLPPRLAGAPVRFMLSVEISTIYKRADRTRKVHHLVYVPDFDTAAELNRRLGRIGNLGSDGRPILGLDSRDLLEITLECGEGAYLVPAHVWTPWFAVLGSKSGFDAVEDCYVDLADHIFALETGLSSDPAMNWRVSALDRYRLMSSSDAHSPPILGRETTVFATELDYAAIRRALETGAGLAGTVEFFPEEGKYHVDGHRKCGVRLEPHETRAHGGRCPGCGKEVTVGVLSRVDELADRPAGARPPGAADYRCLVPLPEVVSEIVGTGPKSKKVVGEIDRLTAALGPELAILEEVPVEDIAARAPVLAEAVGRLRRGEVIREAGYDGEYGVIRVFQPGELQQQAAPALFDVPAAAPATTRTAPATTRPASAPAAGGDRAGATDAGDPTGRSAATEPAAAATGTPGGAGDAGDASDPDLDPDQRSAVEAPGGPLLIVAGPGTGKTRTLTHRLAHLITRRGVAPHHCLAITFTRRAADELAERLAALVPAQAPAVTVATFHRLGARIVREQHERFGLSPAFTVADEARQLAVAAEVTGGERAARRLLAHLARTRPGAAAGTVADPEANGEANTDPELAEAAQRYRKALRHADLVDFDELIALPAALLEADAELAAAYRDRYRWIAVDEYQDVDEAQYRLLRQLAGPDGNLAAIGDPDQAIYGFRGADVGFFLRFRQDFPGARTVQLTRNYRSAPGVVTAALQAIAPTTLVPDRVLRPAAAAASTASDPGRPEGEGAAPAVAVHRAATEQAEASFVARTIEQLLGGASFHSLDSGRVASDGLRGLGFSDFAVLYRTDRQAQALLDAFATAGLPVQKRSHDRLADHPGVAELVTALPEGASGAPVADLLRQAADALVAAAPAAEAERRRAELDAARELLGPLAERCGDDVGRFRTDLALGVEVDTWDPRADRVSLLTLHAAKGLEFPIVFVVGCEEGLLPLRWPGAAPAGGDDPQVAEERRLLFVGMTRARRRLYLTHAAERAWPGPGGAAGGDRARRRSRFLDDLDPSAYVQLDAAPRPRPRTAQLRLL
ncbi:MAG TPA: UvrD-helicase domain-containing protein [Acidimicrobiales bacterium]